MFVSEPLDPGLERLLKFLGYGSPSAPLWLMGPEEGLDVPKGVPVDAAAEASLNVRMQWHQHWVDLDWAHGDGQLNVDMTARGRRTWYSLSKLARLVEEGPDVDLGPTEQTWERIRLLGKSTVPEHITRTFLTEYLPLPSPAQAVWPEHYASEFEWDRAQYTAAMDRLRPRLLRGALVIKRPKALVCYGAQFWERYRKLVGGRRATWSQVQAGRVEHADVKVFTRKPAGATVLPLRVVLLHHVSRICDADLRAAASLVREKLHQTP
jgi:hypothetical protein